MRTAVTSDQTLLLETKLTSPHLRAEHVSRRDLLDRLRVGSHRLTLVAAPPGFGKTTLLAEWVAAEDGPPVAWCSVDEIDNDAARLVAYLAESLRRLEPRIGARTLAALPTQRADAADIGLLLLVDDLANLDRPIVLIIDDYHLITNPRIHEALSLLIERAAPAVHLVLATREDPPLPVGRLRARGELGEIRADDLRFSDEETATFLGEVLGLELSDEDVARLQARTEGWPAALYLAALSIRGRTDPGELIDRYAGDDRYIVDFLTAEVLARQPPERRTFLLRTSVLDRFCAPLTDAVTEREDSATLLADLERSNLLLVPLDRTREWYRFHHLFGDLLRHELAVTDRHIIPELHRRASRWYRDAGLIEDAAHHAFAAGDTDAAVQLVASHYELFVDGGRLATVLRWLDALPPAIAARDWRLCVAGTIVTAHAGELAEAERWFDLAERAPAAGSEEPDRLARLAALCAYLRLLRGDVAAAIEDARRALAAPPAGDPGWALGPQMVLASCLWWSGRMDEAVAIVDHVSRTSRTNGIDTMTVYSLGVRAAMALDQQDDDGAEELARSAIEVMRRAELDEHPWAAMAHIVQGILFGRRGRTAAAAEEIERGRELGQRQAAWQVTVCALLALAEVRHRQHEPAEARRLLARARDLIDSLPDPGDGSKRLSRTERTLHLRGGDDRRATGAPYWELSPRELDVLRLLTSDLSQREIGTQLSVSFNTVRSHTRAIFRKLGVYSRAEAVARARALGILDGGSTLAGQVPGTDSGPREAGAALR